MREPGYGAAGRAYTVWDGEPVTAAEFFSHHARMLGRDAVPTIPRSLATGAGLLLILMVLPGGLGAVLYDTRDWLLRQIAKRRGLVVPSLVADVRVEEPVPEPLLEDAEEAAERAPA